jgi:malate dehydrogenase
MSNQPPTPPRIVVAGRGSALAATAREVASLNLGALTLLGTCRGAASTAAAGIGSRVTVARSADNAPRADILIIAGIRGEEPDEAERIMVSEFSSVSRSSTVAPCSGATETIFIFSGPRSNLRAARFLKLRGHPSEKVIATGGVAGQMARQLRIGRAAGLDPSQVSVLVTGDQDPDLVTLSRYATIAGMPAALRLSDSRKLSRVMEADLPGESALEEGEARAAGVLAAAILKDKRQILCCGIHVQGNFGIPPGQATLPVVIGASGVERIMPVTFTLEERSFVQKTMEQIQEQMTRSGFSRQSQRWSAQAGSGRGRIT